MSDAANTVSQSSQRPDFGRQQSLALVVGLAGIALSVLGWLVAPDQFFRSYLFAWVFWVGLAIGCLPVQMIHHLTGGAWGLVIRRPCEAGARTLPLMLLLFVPVLFGMHSIYEWARPEAVAHDAVLQHKAAYLNSGFFIVRTIVYFAIWIGLAYALSGWSREQDRTGDLRLARKMQVLSGPGIVFYFLAVTFAAVDWIMSIDAHWYSTIFGPLLAAGQLLNAFSFVIVLLVILARSEPMAGVIRPDIYHDLGKLLLAFVMVYAYFSFSQFLIIWAGNLPEEIKWYLEHSHGAWYAIGIALIFGHFFLPFFMLLSRDLKRDGRRLALVAGFLVVMRLIEVFWTMVPLFHPHGLFVHWIDVAATAGVGGIWLWMFLRELGTQPILPLHDPYMQEALGDVAH